MPIKTFKCLSCDKVIRRLISDSVIYHKYQMDLIFTCECGGSRVPITIGPTTQIMETLDNGAMPRAVERHVNAEAMMEERHRNADPLAGTKKNYS
jgi:Na+-translocating ferredoxin:NAD+ oxidoreductase RNF subunit RnfB